MTKKNDLIRVSLSIDKETEIKRLEIVRNGGNISGLFRKYINDNYPEIIRGLKVGELKKLKGKKNDLIRELEALEALEADLREKI